MKKIKWFVLVFCIAASYAKAQYSLQGILINSIKEPVANANVVLQPGNFKTITDNGGIFSFEKLPKGIYQLNIYSNGYQSVDTSINLQNQVILSLSLKVLNVVTDEVIVNASRANQNSGIAFETIDKKTLETTNLGQDIPYLLQLTPSAVVNSDAGTGIGYTGIRIRGSDASRINVSMNGVPLNDAESQQMYWVNLPDIASSTENIQVQRGAGVGASGTASFGGGINLLSNKFPSLAGAEIIGGLGSFNTNKSSITLSSGLLKEKFAFQGRMSRINSDGFIDSVCDRAADCNLLIRPITIKLVP
jgi:iron complex outermembrane receptor protein